MSAISSTHPSIGDLVGARRVSLLRRMPLPRRGAAFGLIIATALAAFELFNYSTTQHALADLLGDLRFAGISLATVLSLAFCGIDFGGIARLFTPQREAHDRLETWYLLAAWFLAGGMNAILTWWAVSLGVLAQPTLGNELISRQEMITFVPVFVAAVVWMIRILLIGALTMNGEGLLSQGAPPAGAQRSASPLAAFGARASSLPVASRNHTPATRAASTRASDMSAGETPEDALGRGSNSD